MTETPNPNIIDADTLTGEMRPIRRAVLALGSNLGERMDNLQGAVRALADTPDVWVTGVSPVYETEPVDAPDGSDMFLNAVVLADTTLAASRLLDRALAIEDAFDRERSEVKNAPRTLDVDLIVVGDRRADDDQLRLPHPRAARARLRAAPLARRRPAGGVPRPGPGGRPALRGRRGRDQRAATTWSSRSSDHPRAAMTREGGDPLGAGPDDDDEEPRSPRARCGRTSYVVVTVWAVAGLVLGWLWHPVAEQLSGTAPVVSWAQPAALWLVAVVIGITWWQTYRAVQVRRERLEPHRAVNRLVLGRAGALVGALVAGGYAGYAVSWIGDPAELAGQRILRSAVAVVAGVVIVVWSAPPRARVSRPQGTRGPIACPHGFPTSNTGNTKASAVRSA